MFNELLCIIKALFLALVFLAVSLVNKAGGRMVSLAFVNTFQDHLLAHVSCTATCYQHSQSGG